jgi:type II secretory pathway pseudopilin PulG
MFLFFPVKINNRYERAQVLLEVITAVAVVSVALTTIIGSLVSNYRAAVLTREYTKALFLLEDQGQALFLMGAEAGSSTEKTCSGDAGMFRCSTVAARIKDFSNAALSEVLVTVIWVSGKKGRSLSMSTFIAGD